MEPKVGDLCAGAECFLVKPGGNADFSALPSDSDCGCDGELDLWETESTVDAGEGGARDSRCFPGAVLGRFSSGGALNNDVEALSFSLVLDPFRLNHLSFPIALLLGDGNSIGEILGATSDLLNSWDEETLAGDGTLPDDELVETVGAASGWGFFSPL